MSVFVNHCPLCVKDMSSPRNLINHYEKIHGVYLKPRLKGQRRPGNDTANGVEAACPSCFSHFPVENRQALIQHYLAAHDVHLAEEKQEPQARRPSRDAGGPSRTNNTTTGNKTLTSTQGRQRLPSPAHSVNSDNDQKEDVENVINGIIAGFHRFLRIVGRE